ncbi:MAG: ribonuclease J, partial [Malacoplasma sp.]
MEEKKANKENDRNYHSERNSNKATNDNNSMKFVDFNKFNQHTISLDYNNEKDTTYIFAMGGIEEIGKNMYVIEHNEETIVVDAGIKFASSDMLGFNGLIPNFEYFNHNNREIDKLFITHGHEDHIGGVPYLVQKCKIKTICGPLLAIELIKRKLSEFREIKIPEFEIFSDDTIISTKYFTVDFFRVCHSIPDCFGLAIKGPNGNIASAGDYRFDFGCSTDNTNIHKIIEISNRGIDVFLAESTNSDQPGFSESEDLILKNIGYILKTTKSRVFISTFASNLGRIERIIEIAINLNRKICIMGRSMEANIKTSRKVGYIKLSDIDFVNGKEITSTPDENLLVILTGSQGEEMAALNLMAENKYSK